MKKNLETEINCLWTQRPLLGWTLALDKPSPPSFCSSSSTPYWQTPAGEMCLQYRVREGCLSWRLRVASPSAWVTGDVGTPPTSVSPSPPLPALPHRLWFRVSDVSSFQWKRILLLFFVLLIFLQVLFLSVLQRDFWGGGRATLFTPPFKNLKSQMCYWLFKFL